MPATRKTAASKRNEPKTILSAFMKFSIIL
jgi:hypothetical protein